MTQPSPPGWDTMELLAQARADVDSAGSKVSKAIVIEDLVLTSAFYRIREAWQELNTAVVAAELVMRGTPLADVFSNGEPAPAIPTPRQVLYLAELKRRETNPLRSCSATTGRGEPCQNYARDNLPTCGVHRRRPTTGREPAW